MTGIASRVSLGLIAILLTASSSIYAQTLYKFLDKDGKVVYSDKPPKEGPSTKIEIEQNVNPMKGPPTAAPPERGKPASGVNTEARIALRDKLRSAVDAAEARLATAKKTLEEGLTPHDDEWQPTFSAPDNGGKPNTAGVITGRGGRVACGKVKSPDGSERVVCPALMVPSQTYHDRVKELEEAVERAEAVLLEAQLNYRRNAPD